VRRDADVSLTTDTFVQGEQEMNRLLKTMLIGASVASLAVVSAFAQERAERSNDDRARAPASQMGREATNPEIAADAPNARLAGLIRNTTPPVAQRNKNIANVRRIATGVYCIRPTAASGINTATAVVTLTVEYFFSFYNESKVQWASRQSGCTANEIGVYTLADVNLNARYTFSNTVSFSIIVP
jgi:hypothetical protein